MRSIKRKEKERRSQPGKASDLANLNVSLAQHSEQLQPLVILDLMRMKGSPLREIHDTHPSGLSGEETNQLLSTEEAAFNGLHQHQDYLGLTHRLSNGAHEQAQLHIQGSNSSHLDYGTADPSLRNKLQRDFKMPGFAYQLKPMQASLA